MQLEEDQPGQREAKHIKTENDSDAICIYVWKIKKKKKTETKNVKTGNCINISKYFDNRLK